MLLSNTMSGNPCSKPMQHRLCCYQSNVKKIVRYAEKIQVVNLSVQQTNQPVFWWLFLHGRKLNLLFWLNPQVIVWKRNRRKLNSIQNFIQGLGTSIATVDTTDLVGGQLEWGCSVFFQNELLVFGVHESSPDWSSVSY